MKTIASILIAVAAAVTLDPKADLMLMDESIFTPVSDDQKALVATEGCGCDYQYSGAALDCNCHLPDNGDCNGSGSLLEFQSGSRQMNEAY